jgi:hypothetical protein
MRLPALIGGAVLALTVLAAPVASASPRSAQAIPHTVDGQAAGYQATLSKITSVHTQWTLPDLPCGILDGYGLYIGVDMGSAGSDAQNESVADFTCQEGYHSTVEDLSSEPDGNGSLDSTDQFAPGDTMSTSISLVGLKWEWTMADLTRGWSYSWSRVARPLKFTTVGVYVTLAGIAALNPIVFTDTTVNGQPLAATDPVATDCVNVDGTVDHTSPIAADGSFTVSQQSS